MSFFKKLLGKKDQPPENNETSPEEHPLDDPLAAERRVIHDLVAEYRARMQQGRYWIQEDFDSFEAFPVIRDADRVGQARFVETLVSELVGWDQRMVAFHAQNPNSGNQHLNQEWVSIRGTRILLNSLLQRLLKRKLPLSPEAIAEMFEWYRRGPKIQLMATEYPFAFLISAMEDFVKGGVPIDGFREALQHLAEGVRRCYQGQATRKLGDRLQTLLGTAPEIPVQAGEAWADAALKDLNELEPTVKAAWIALLNHAKSASGSAPSAKWLTAARGYLSAIHDDEFVALVTGWFTLVDKKRPQSDISIKEWVKRCAVHRFSQMTGDVFNLLPEGQGRWTHINNFRDAISGAADPWAYLRDFPEYLETLAVLDGPLPRQEIAEDPPPFDPVEDHLIIAPHIELLCGLVWMCGLSQNPAVARALGNLCVSALRKVPGIGPRAVRLGNASITALGMMATPEALGRLAFLKVKVKFGGARNAIDKTLGKLSEKLGMSREDLEEMSIPAYGMEEVGRLTQAVGDFTAVLTVINSRATELMWLRTDGKVQKSLPAAVKKEHAEELKELTAAKKDIEKMLPAQVERLDALYLQRKSWPYATWRERYLDHPLIGVLARRLIWNFSTGCSTVAGVWSGNGITDQTGNGITANEVVTTVSLWHPLGEPSTAVFGWRDFLEEMQIVQPFKQAHREIYVVAPAEENTRVYSNRFAGHLLRQHQFNALCSARTWKNQLRLMVDADYSPPTRWLPAWGLRAEYWVEGAGEEILESGAYRYLNTDQVRFYREDARQVRAHAGGGGYESHGTRAEPLSLTEIDPLVFSELMRDVDLFVGVASIGNDPIWQDGGAEERSRRDYWTQVAFGDLGASAITRKAILERLIPRLKIATQCSFGDHFLNVEGRRHRYKIHLGSGNILIEPQGKYLCIIPAQAQVDKTREKLFLPFEGDRTLSVIISKAFLLAADDEITDPTITRQL
jgi:hypothetical protein